MNRDNLKKLFRDFSKNEENSLSLELKSELKNRIFQNLGTQEEVQKPSLFRFSLFVPILVTPILLLVVILSGISSAKAVPGDVLYPLKRTIEQSKLLLIPGVQNKAELQVKFAEERLQELEKLNEPETEKGSGKMTEDKPKVKTSKQLEKEKVAKEELEKTISELSESKEKLKKEGRKKQAENIEKTIEKLEKNRPAKNERNQDKE